jgi:hypothetical protein
VVFQSLESGKENTGEVRWRPTCIACGERLSAIYPKKLV